MVTQKIQSGKKAKRRRKKERNKTKIKLGENQLRSNYFNGDWSSCLHALGNVSAL